MSLSFRNFLGFGVLAAIQVVGSPLVFCRVTTIKSSIHQIKHENLFAARTAGQMRLDTVQVQQWLTDISATRGLDGLNDGFDVAKPVHRVVGRQDLEILRLAASEEAEWIEQSNQQTTRGAAFAHGTGEAFGEISGGSTRNHALMLEIATASREQASGVDQLHHAVAAIERTIHENTQNADTSAQSARQLSEFADSVGLAVKHLKRVTEVNSSEGGQPGETRAPRLGAFRSSILAQQKERSVLV